MKLRLFNQKFLGIAILLTIAILSAFSTSVITSEPSYGSNQEFFCEKKGGMPTTYAQSADGPKPIIRWRYNPSPELTPFKRCQVVAQRFQRSFDNGTLKTIIAGQMNGFPVICTNSR